MRRLALAMLGMVVLGATACTTMDGGMMADKKSLFERLGGRPAITAVVDDFIANVGADARINRRFMGTNMPRLKMMLVDQICEATGGPCKYMGQTMTDAHRGMNITDAEFSALVEDLVKSLDKFKVAALEKNELLTALGGMKPQIVGK